jgi:hypothetical protein
MKKNLLFIVTLFVSLNGFARIAFGPEIGFNASKLNYSTSTSTNILGITIPPPDFKNSIRSGARFGVIADVDIFHHISIQPGIFYSMQGGNQKGTTSVTIPVALLAQFTQLPLPISLNAPVTIDTKTKLNYLHVPVNVIYHFNKFFAGAGPYISYALNGTIKGNTTASIPVIGDYNTSIDSTISFGSDKGSIRRFDYGVSITAGYDLPFGLFIRAYYQMGLAELSNDLNSSGKNTCFGFSAGYLYHRRK